MSRLQDSSRSPRDGCGGSCCENCQHGYHEEPLLLGDECKCPCHLQAGDEEWGEEREDVEAA